MEIHNVLDQIHFVDPYTCFQVNCKLYGNKQITFLASITVVCGDLSLVWKTRLREYWYNDKQSIW